MYYNFGCFLLFCLTRVVAGGESRLVNANDVNVIDYPYQLLLRTDSNKCGASIIGENWVLTSASCIEGAQYGVIRSGITRLNIIGNKHEVVGFYLHPNWTSFGLYDYDFGLVQVDTPFKLNTRGVAKVQLADTEPEIGTTLTVSGWGASTYGGVNTMNLQAANLSAVSFDACQTSYGKFPLTERMLCAGSNNRGTCSGDSGGPLVDRITGVQYGIVSFIPRACTSATPSVFSNVANQRDWIRNITGI